MNNVYDKQTFKVPTYDGDETEDNKSIDDHNNRALCSTQTISSYPLSMKDKDGGINYGVTIFVYPYKDRGQVKHTIYCYLYKDLKKFLYNSPPLFSYTLKDDLYNNPGVDESFPILKLTSKDDMGSSGLNIKLNYFMLLRYTAFLVYNPMDIPTGSVFGVSTLHGLVQKVYDVRPISKSNFLESGMVDFLELNNKLVDFKEEDFTPGNFPPYKIEIIHDRHFIRERERVIEGSAIENIYHENGDLTIGLFDKQTEKTTEFFRIKLGYTHDDQGYYERKRTFTVRAANKIVGNTSAEVKAPKKNLYDITITRGDKKYKEHISIWEDKTYQDNTEYSSILAEDDGDKIFKDSIESQDLEKIEQFLKDGLADPTADNNYAIRFSSEKGFDKVVDLLLKDGRADPTARDNYAIKVSTGYGHDKVVDLLLKDGRTDPTDDNNFAIRLASEKGFDKVVDLLLKDGRADPTTKDNYAIKVSSSKGFDKVVDLLLKDGRADPTADNNYAIKISRANRYNEIVRLLLADGRVS
ncbi:MAG: ankyrin repeat domain-containing protein [Candidatus Colwellbacteria bacterium]|nr:ankyrin repeat domain-containing protein [Candidatus Colwellbacteria bacterium]